jgi:Transglutaminase-like superfamily.
MNTKLTICLALILILGSAANAQKAPVKWGKILPADTSFSSYKSDPNASAVVLCDYGTSTVGPRTEYTRIVRIKILKDDGLKYATVEISYRFYDRYEEFSELKAHTINVSNGKLVTSKLKRKNIEDVQTDRWNKKKILHFPDAKVGSILEYTYTVHSLDLVKLRDWYFQSAIPVLWSEYRVYISRHFDYLVSFQKGHALDFDEQKAFADKLQWLYDADIKKARKELIGKKNVLYESPKGTIKVYYAQGESYKFIMKDMPAFNPQQPVLAQTDFFPVVKVHLYLADDYYPFYYRRILTNAKDDYDWDPAFMKYHNTMLGYVKYWLPTWDETVKHLLSSDHFGDQLIKAVDYKSIFDKAYSNGASELDKTKGIYEYLKANVKWDGTYSMYADKSVKEVLRNKTGNSGEVNLLLINVLQHAGIDAQPVLIRTLDNGRPENVYPVHHQFNHVIALVQVSGQAVYLDLSGTDSGFGQLPWNVNKAEGFLVTKTNYKWVDVVNTIKPAGPVITTSL